MKERATDATPSPKKVSRSGKVFDPFERVFVAQEERPEHLEDIDPISLTPFERAWLLIDGTVTRFLEAQLMEPIDIVDCGQTKELLQRDHVWLDVPKGSEVVARRVLLKGRTSGRTHASAASLVVPDRVKNAVGRTRERIPEGLGRMLLDGRIEQYRELLWYGRVAVSATQGDTRGLSGDYYLTRTYRIIVKKKPTMLITEWFELGSGDRA